MVPFHLFTCREDPLGHMDLAIQKTREWSFSLLGIQEQAHCPEKVDREAGAGGKFGRRDTEGKAEQRRGGRLPLGVPSLQSQPRPWALKDPRRDVYGASQEQNLETSVKIGNALGIELSDDTSQSIHTREQRCLCRLISASLVEAEKEGKSVSVYVCMCVRTPRITQPNSRRIV